jgi:hypothetical protein
VTPFNPSTLIWSGPGAHIEVRRVFPTGRRCLPANHNAAALARWRDGSNRRLLKSRFTIFVALRCLPAMGRATRPMINLSTGSRTVIRIVRGPRLVAGRNQCEASQGICYLRLSAGSRVAVRRGASERPRIGKSAHTGTSGTQVAPSLHVVHVLDENCRLLYHKRPYIQ